MTLNQVISLNLAKHFDFETLKVQFIEAHRGSLYKDALYLDRPQGKAFVFPFGVLVAWGLNHEDLQYLQAQLIEHSTQTHPQAFHEQYPYEIGAERQGFSNDRLKLIQGDTHEMLALSHALAQSAKLLEFEEAALQTINSTVHIPETIARTGSSRLKRKETAQLRGKLFLAKSEIILRYDLLDAPEFFWEYPELEPSYVLAAGYLELKPRVDLLNRKLETIHELLEMLADEQKHQHSSLLEWIIIWLIAIEIIIFFTHDIFKWF
ncbi:Uncharacterized protein, Rmd1/YagE family [Allopseudospirillum japonicum]|uniref:Uncharacterized protein, Rmd1/YagE family n=1 Tax=Allopseudospirillum japonicum TaxID=64971 RepID=A0A1H6QDM4_9GAMM|nr:RMD1 family protein [Allopseudospirillum japonicum]SEI37610.1 Uncharacterized protein, Rmd1/YagE family [Allopseudospirillum japonicum]